MKLLFLSRWFPYPPDNGSKLRIYNLIRQLSKRFEIDLVSFRSKEDQIHQQSELFEICHSVTTVPYTPYQPNSYDALTGFFSSAPRSISSTYNHTFQIEVDRLARACHYDVAIASQIDMAAYVPSLPDTLKILEEVEVTRYLDNVVSQKNVVKRLRNRLTVIKLKHYLRKLARNYDALSVVSQPEADRLKEFIPEMDQVWIVPNGVDCGYYNLGENSRIEDSIIYTGSLTYDANLDAVRYFVESIFPIIRESRPDCQLFVTGQTKGVDIDDLKRVPGVNFTGYLDDIRLFLSSCSLLIVSLRIGGGTRLKILEALAVGTPVVSTSKGAEGLGLIHGKDLLIADTPQEFARSVIQLLENPVLFETIRNHGHETVNHLYNWDVVGNRFLSLINKLAEPYSNEKLSQN